MRYATRLLWLVIVAAAVGTLSSPKQASPKMNRPHGYVRFTGLAPATGHQRQCKAAADREFHSAGSNSGGSASFTGHYNLRLNRCFIEYDDIFANSTGQTVVNRSLSDAEGREYADFVSIRNGARESAATSVCEIILPSGELLDCHSEQEFNDFLLNYLE